MSPLVEFDALRTAAGVVDRSPRGAVLVTRPDARSFLQALVSADVDAVGDGLGVHSLLLSPQGKLDVDFRLFRVGDDAWLDCEREVGPQLAASLLRFRVRVKVDVVDRTAESGLLSIIGPESVARFPGPVPEAVLHAHVAWGDARVVRTDWAGTPGLDLMGPRAAVDEIAVALAGAGLPAIGAVAFEAFRVSTGVPRQPVDVDDTTIPQEAFLERDAVSFTKGCFLGQELVCRIDSRGHVNRFLRKLTDIDGAWPPTGAEIVVDGKVVGAITSVAPADVPTGALGYVRREVVVPAPVELRWEGGHAVATAVEL